MAFKAAPLSSGHMLMSMFGLIVSLLVIMDLSRPWGLTLSLVFGMMFIASLISMTHAPVLSALEISFKKKKKK